MQDDILVIITFFIYMLAVFAIGVVAWRRTQNSTDYFLGGRQLSPAVAAISAGASDMSGWVLMGLPGAAYMSGLSGAWISVGLICGIAASWLFMARRLRRYTFALDDAVTIPAYLQRRFGENGPWLRSISALFILLFFLFYVSAGLIGGGKLFEAVFGIDYRWAVVAGALAVVSYTLFGGFLAVSWTDVAQALLMGFALILVPILVIGEHDGFSQHLNAKNPELLNIWTDASGKPLGVLALVSLLSWGFGYFGQPHILARYQALRSENDTPVAAAIGISWGFFMYACAILIGLCGIVWFDTPLDDAEKVFIHLVDAIFDPWLAGILLAAILAAIMSTIDSQLLVTSSALAEDFVQVLRKEKLSEKQSLKIGRYAVFGLAGLATLLALDPDSKLLSVVAYAWAGLGAAFGPALLLSLYWRRMNRFGALAGILVGGLTVVIWGNVEGGLFEVYELLPGFVFSAIAIVVVSLLTAAPPAAVSGKFDELMKK